MPWPSSSMPTPAITTRSTRRRMRHAASSWRYRLAEAPDGVNGKKLSISIGCRRAMAVPMGKIEFCYGTNSIFQPEIRRQRVPQANRVPAIPKSWTRSIPRRSPAYCVNIAATSHVSSWPFSRCCSAHPNGSVSRALSDRSYMPWPPDCSGLTSVILPVFLALVVFSLMRKTQNKDENLHMAPRMVHDPLVRLLYS